MLDLFCATISVLLIGHVSAHSQMTWPQSMSPHTCRLGGEPQFGVENCPGPCDLRAVEGGYANFGSSDNPAATFKRGQTYTMKYQRNNHPPGGFIRLTMVVPGKMMDKSEHAKNAFYYSCWGGNAVKAAPDEQERDQYGFTMIGSDAEQHDLEPGYYTTEVKIPAVIPDGDYVLGWAWYGGTGGGEVENNGPATKEPVPWGYFSDYWACSYVRVEGGDNLISEHTPIFNNDMSQFSSEGCMSANDALGICVYEPCEVTGEYQKPKEFKDGKTPSPLTPEHFGGISPNPQQDNNPPVAIPTETTESMKEPMKERIRTSESESGPDLSSSELFLTGRRSCRCIARGEGCWKRLAERTLDYCVAYSDPYRQPSMCKELCCAHCENRRSIRICQNENVKGVCSM